MDVNRLLSDELGYELSVRGASDLGTADEKRRRLRGLLRLEKFGSVTCVTIPGEEVEQELTVCAGKLEELAKRIRDFDKGNARNESRSIQTRLLHVSGRISRLNHEPSASIRAELLDRCSELCAQLEDVSGPDSAEAVGGGSLLDLPNELLPTVVSPSQAVSPPHDPVPDMISLGQPRANVEEDCRAPALNSTVAFEDRLRNLRFSGDPACKLRNLDMECDMASTYRDPSRTFDIVSKWRLTYDGNSSVMGFIERVDELRTACGISKHQLAAAAVCLFSGAALSWYRAVRSQVTSWDCLLSRLKATYLSSEYEEDIWSDIRNRTQGPQEKTAIFISMMENLFGKLERRPSEQTRLRIIRRNLAPYLQNQLSLHNFTTISELRVACRSVEDVHDRAQRLKPPPSDPRHVAEPDLMYRPSRNSNVVRISSLTSPSAGEGVATGPSTGRYSNTAGLTCWNCRNQGHTRRECHQPILKRCFRCGRQGFTVATCPDCGGGTRPGVNTENRAGGPSSAENSTGRN